MYLERFFWNFGIVSPVRVTCNFFYNMLVPVHDKKNTSYKQPNAPTRYKVIHHYVIIHYSTIALQCPNTWLERCTKITYVHSFLYPTPCHYSKKQHSQHSYEDTNLWVLNYAPDKILKIRLHTSCLLTNNSKRSVKPGFDLCHLANGLIISGWLIMKVGFTHVSSKKCPTSCKTITARKCRMTSFGSKELALHTMKCEIHRCITHLVYHDP